MARRGESPIATSRWWRCSRSPQVIGEPRAARRTSAMAVSTTGTPSATTGASRSVPGVPWPASGIELAASTSPRKRLPLSPMKMLAGRRLCRRNPRQDPATAAPETARTGSPRRSATATAAAAAAAAMPPARPSSPSMRFMAFMAPTRKRRVKGRARSPSGMGAPNGFATASMRSPPAQTSAAAASCATSFTRGEMPRTSSTAPTATTKTPASAMARIRGPWTAAPPAAAASATPPRNAAAMARPPMRGTAVRWHFRAVSG